MMPDPPVIDPGNPVRQRKKRLDPAHLRLAQHERNIHQQRLLDAAIESTNHRSRKCLIGPEPRKTIVDLISRAHCGHPGRIASRAHFQAKKSWLCTASYRANIPALRRVSMVTNASLLFEVVIFSNTVSSM